jgi:hypothetical protein
MKAVREQRVMTVLRRNVGTRKDSGEVAFHQGRERVYLVFPRSLRSFVGARIVGIDYDRVREPAKQSHGPLPKPKKPEPRSVPQVLPPAPKRFKVNVQVVAKHRKEVEVDAADATEARKKAIDWVSRNIKFSPESLRVTTSRTKVI